MSYPVTMFGIEPLDELLRAAGRRVRRVLDYGNAALFNFESQGNEILIYGRWMVINGFKAI